MIKYPDSECVSHKNIQTSEPVCIICMDEQMNAKDAAIDALAKYFTSGNAIPVERATIKADDFWRIVGPAGLADPRDCHGGKCKHASDCSVHNAPAYPPGQCDCGVEK